MPASLPLKPWSSLDVNSRDHLIQFWLSAPVDMLETLWNLRFGEVTLNLVKQLSPSYSFTPEQIELRNLIGRFFSDNGLSHPLAPNLMLANFLLSPPGLLQINNAEQFFPDWLVTAYIQAYSDNTKSPVFQPATSPDLVSTSTISSDKASQAPSDITNKVNDTFIPPVLPDFPNNIPDLVANRIQLNRLLGLSNLYYIDPGDSEIKSELMEIRSKFARAIIACPEESLEQYWASDLGDRYWALVRSGIQSEDLSPDDSSLKDQCVSKLNPSNGGGFGTPGSTNAFLVAMMYFVPGSVSVDDPHAKLPKWLLPSYLEIFSQAIQK